MIDFLLDTSLLVGLVIFVVITISFSLSIYFGAYYIVKNHLKKNHERVGRNLFRVAASLLALILSITFANQRVDFFNIKKSIEAEASAIVDVNIDLDLFDTDEGYAIRQKLLNYILYTSEDGWQSLQNNPFRSEVFVLFREIYSDINYLEARTPFQERLKSNLLSDIDNMSDYLQVRLYSFRQASSPLIYISVFGLGFLMILFTVYPPDRITIGFLTIYISFIGIVLYFILMMSNPLQGPLQIEPGPFHVLQEAIELNY